MIYNLNKLQTGKKVEFDYEPDFSNKETYKTTLPLVEVLSTKVHVTLLEVGDILTVSFKGNSKVTLVCSYTLEHFQYNLRFFDDLEYSFNEEDVDMEHLEDTVNLNLDILVFDALTASVPMVPVKPGAKLPDSGKNYRVISESELRKEEDEQLDPRFAALDNVEL